MPKTAQYENLYTEKKKKTNKKTATTGHFLHQYPGFTNLAGQLRTFMCTSSRN